ncbi:hypothetical protein PFISCL1PPCAC_20405, partial [Pristionchus fissidentatus]
QERSLRDQPAPKKKRHNEFILAHLDDTKSTKKKATRKRGQRRKIEDDEENRVTEAKNYRQAERGSPRRFQLVVSDHSQHAVILAEALPEKGGGTHHYERGEVCECSEKGIC